MRIAVTGSWRDQDAEEWTLRDKETCFRAVGLMGAELVKLGHRLVVATDSPHTADRAAVDGAKRAIAREGVLYEPVVDLLRSDADAFRQLALRRRGFLNLRTAPESGEVTKLYQVQRAEFVLAVGGARKTLQAAICGSGKQQTRRSRAPTAPWSGLLNAERPQDQFQLPSAHGIASGPKTEEDNVGNPVRRSFLSRNHGIRQIPPLVSIVFPSPSSPTSSS